MKALTVNCLLLIMTAFYCYSQNTYPKLIQFNRDSVVAFTPIQAKDLLGAAYQRDHLHKYVKVQDSIIRIKTIYIAELEQAKKDFNSVVDGYNALAAIRGEQLEIKIEYINQLQKQLKRAKRKAIWLPIGVGVGGGLLGYFVGKI